jgi:hypothetical protein
MHGYVWGTIVFLLHLSGGICVVANLAHKSWLIGIALGIGMVLSQALFPALLFWCITMLMRRFSIQSPIVRVCMWLVALAIFIFWTDQYCLWIFGIKEGYPLMHPLLPLMQQPQLLVFLPVLGKQIITLFFLLVPASCVFVLWYKNCRAILFFVVAMSPWMLCCWIGLAEKEQPEWYHQIKSLPCMSHSTVKNPIVTIKVVAHQLQKIIAQYPNTKLVVMPESAFNITHFADIPELTQLWNEQHLGKAVHLIFGTCRWREGDYYNSLHWVYNGVLQDCFDKKHAMLITERLSDWMNGDMMRTIYFRDGLSITRSCKERSQFCMAENLIFVPYICSELFFSELPDDNYEQVPIIAIVNDTLLIDSYIQKLLLLLARFKALQWQRDIVYVSYGQSLFINTQGGTVDIN